MSRATTSSDSESNQLPRLLNLGCGPDYRDEYHNVDATPGVDPDEVVDLNVERWPWPDDHFQHILASHVVEHLDDPTHAMQEAARILGPGGRLEVHVPVGRDAHTDPTHQQIWTYDTPTFYDHEEGPPWIPDVPLELVDRTVHVWLAGQMKQLNWVLQHIAGRAPRLAEHLCVAGELIATYDAAENA